MMRQPHYETLFVARQPVLDSALNTWGYFHYYRRCMEHTYSEFSDPVQATLSVIQCLPACMDTCGLKHKALVHLPGPAVLTAVPKALGPDCVTPVIALDDLADAAYLEALHGLREDGFTLALDLTSALPPDSPLLDLVDIVILDLREPLGGLEGLASMTKALSAKGLTLLAKRVESHESAHLARELGFALFSGYFFREPQTLTQRKVSAAETTRLNLLDLLSHPEPPTDQLVAAIEADASVSYRVLGMLNSAHFGLLKKVSSVRQALLLAGWTHLCAWLRVMVMADMTPTTKARELLHLSAQRAKFFELLAQASDRREMAESLFLVGLFSLLPAMLDMPMDCVLEKLALDEDMRAGLCGQPGPYAAWLGIAQAIEDTRWDDMAEHAQKLSLPTGSVADAYNASFQWADKLLSALPAPANGKGRIPKH
ncbi:MAG: HDOD domain-containing protein [Proteobacteria bacterium]|nr:HDOD domain-containing protein [Pseudomonadota bacterium]